MFSITIEFIQTEVAFELSATTTIVSNHDAILRCIRGTNGSGSGTFPWSTGVKACCLLLVKYVHLGATTECELSGSAKSAAAALDSALAKTPAWIIDMFGCDFSGVSTARRLFRRINPERKRPGPVRVLINPNVIKPADIKIIINGAIATAEACRDLYRALSNYFAPIEGAEADIFGPSSPAPPAPSTPRDATDAPAGGSCIIAECDLSVIKSILVAWDINSSLQQRGFKVEQVTWDWSDDLLDAVHDGKVHIAIYNTSRILRYVAENDGTNVINFSEFGYSMGGRNFFVLARRDSTWPVGDFSAFLDRLHQGATIAVPERSDMLDNFLEVLRLSTADLVKMGVRVIRIPVSQGLETLDLQPDALLIHGQNVRMKARFRGDYHEVVNYDLLPLSAQRTLSKNAGNSVIINRIFLEQVGSDELSKLVEEAKLTFYSSWSNPKLYDQLIKEVIASERKYGKHNEDELRFVAECIIFETYRFGRPV